MLLSVAPSPCSSWEEMGDTMPPGEPHQPLWWEGWAGYVLMGPARVTPKASVSGESPEDKQGPEGEICPTWRGLGLTFSKGAYALQPLELFSCHSLMSLCLPPGS